VHKNCSYFKVTHTRYRTRIIVNSCYWTTCKLVFATTRTHYTGTRTRIDVNPALMQW